MNFSTLVVSISASLAAVLVAASLSNANFFSASRTKAQPSLVGCCPCFSSNSLCLMLNGRPLLILTPPRASSTSPAVFKSSAGVPVGIALSMGGTSGMVRLRVLRGGRPWASRRARSCSALISSMVSARLSERGSNEGGRSYLVVPNTASGASSASGSPTITAAPSEGMSAVAIPATSAAAAASAASLAATPVTGVTGSVGSVGATGTPSSPSTAASSAAASCALALAERLAAIGDEAATTPKPPINSARPCLNDSL